MDYSKNKKELEKAIELAVIKFQEETKLFIHNLDVNIQNSLVTASRGHTLHLRTNVETSIIIKL